MIFRNLSFNRKEVEYDEGIIQDAGNTGCRNEFIRPAYEQCYGSDYNYDRR